MHHAFHIEEILINIFSFCHTFRIRRPPRGPTRRQRWYANSDLAALARTCRTFKEPALDMIWAELNDLTPLVRCLLEASWIESEGVYSFQKRLEQAEWDIILGYSHRVRALPRLWNSLGLAGDCIETLSIPPTSIESIFPNLRVIGLHEPSAAVAPLVRYFINPKITEIWLERTENIGAAIKAFGEGCPLVTGFYVSQWAWHANRISDLICRWPNLCFVKCHEVGLNVDALYHLSRL
ncbi:hypothetical protein OG21DRAFT_1466340, partial [Imleria badia]